MTRRPKRHREVHHTGKAHQTGGTTIWLDMLLPAKKPGWRKSKSGKYYYEARKNRSDMPGKRI